MIRNPSGRSLLGAVGRCSLDRVSEPIQALRCAWPPPKPQAARIMLFPELYTSP